MTRPIPIVADIPAAEPGLGFPAYVGALADAIRGGEPPQFTIGLYGAWGSGKSSLLGAIAQSLSHEDSTVLPVLFDAWRHERADHIVVPLLYRITEAADRSGAVALTKHLRRALEAVLFSLNFNVLGVGVDAGRVHDNFEQTGLPELEAAFAKPFEALRSLPDTLGDRRIAVLVDDLDRCSPEKVVSLLEAINLVMDVPGFIFVLALDYDVLVHAVNTRYPHVSGHEFIEKMVQLPFRVPPLVVNAEDFLGQLIPQWERRKHEFPPAFAGSVMEVADLGLRANPRQIKRLINSFLLLARIVEERCLNVDQELMAAMIGLQLRWPDHYQDLLESVLADDEHPFETLASSEDKNLARYGARFFAQAPSEAALRELLQLTAVIAGDARAAGDDRPVREVREERRENLLEELASLGFAKSPQSMRGWYHPGLADFRVVLQQTVLRFEVKNRGDQGRPWQLEQTFDYRDSDAAVAELTNLLHEVT